MDHFFNNIEGWFQFFGIYSRVVQEAQPGAHFVEVGAWKGKSAAYMAVEIANSGKQIQFDVVDTWRGSNEPFHQQDPFVQAGTLYEHFLDNMKPVEGFYTPKRMTSVEAANTYADGSLDFVMLDAGHEYEDVRSDILAWWPKVKVGGIIAGDDYQNDFPGVMQAVNELFPGCYAGNGFWAVRKQ